MLELGIAIRIVRAFISLAVSLPRKAKPGEKLAHAVRADRKPHPVEGGCKFVFTPQQARDFAKEKLGEILKGIDVAEHRKEHREKLAGLTFAEAVEKFLKVHAEPTRYWKEKRARLTSGDVKALASKPLSTLSRKHIADAIDRAKARTEAAARLLFSDLRPLFKWAHERELVDANPMAGLRAPKPAEARERILEDDEIRAFWQAADEASWPFAAIYKLLLLTGARREEVAGMKWSELDLDAGVWMLPGNRTKNSRDHRIPLARQAVAILDRRAIAAIKEGLGYKDSDLVFSTTGTTSPSGFSKAKRALDARMQEILRSKFKPWRVHDLRRTCATGMEHLGVELRVIEAALNHVSGTKAGIVGVYQRAEHREAVRAAFEAWDSPCRWVHLPRAPLKRRFTQQSMSLGNGRHHHVMKVPGRDMARFGCR